MRKIMTSGFFDPFHDMALDYIKQASRIGSYMICVIGSDKQLIMKKGKFNIPEQSRAEILDLILKGLRIEHEVIINYYDTKTTLIANALRAIKPNILIRSGDKTPEDIPEDELRACQENNIDIQYTKPVNLNRHGSNFT